MKGMYNSTYVCFLGAWSFHLVSIAQRGSLLPRQTDASAASRRQDLPVYLLPSLPLSRVRRGPEAGLEGVAAKGVQLEGVLRVDVPAAQQGECQAWQAHL